VRAVRGGAVLLARVPAHGLEGAQAGVHGGPAMSVGESKAAMSLEKARSFQVKVLNARPYLVGRAPPGHSEKLTVLSPSAGFFCQGDQYSAAWGRRLMPGIHYGELGIWQYAQGTPQAGAGTPKYRSGEVPGHSASCLEKAHARHGPSP
jgi:hypothetical protein